MTDMTAVDRLDSYIREGRLTRHQWTGTDDQGREIVCLLVALSPEVGENKDPSACPASVMPEWLAHLTPWMDDMGTDAAWYSMVKRYAGLARRWHVLSEETWTRLNYHSRAIIVREAMTHTKDEKVIKVCERVASLCERRANGELGLEAAMKEAAAAAAAAAAGVKAERAAAAAAVDRMTAAILDAIEAAILRAEQAC